MVHPQVAEMSDLHLEMGVSLPPYSRFDPRNCGGKVIVTPPVSPKSGILLHLPRRKTAFISGWALDRSTVFRQRCDAAFPLSDHADFPELLKLVELVKPGKVYTLHGSAVEFADTLRERGVEALALGESNQLSLGL